MIFHRFTKALVACASAASAVVGVMAARGGTSAVGAIRPVLNPIR
jgi:hypothetical protein